MTCPFAAGLARLNSGDDESEATRSGGGDDSGDRHKTGRTRQPLKSKDDRLKPCRQSSMQITSSLLGEDIEDSEDTQTLNLKHLRAAVLMLTNPSIISPHLHVRLYMLRGDSSNRPHVRKEKKEEEEEGEVATTATPLQHVNCKDARSVTTRKKLARSPPKSRLASVIETRYYRAEAHIRYTYINTYTPCQNQSSPLILYLDNTDGCTSALCKSKVIESQVSDLRESKWIYFKGYLELLNRSIRGLIKHIEFKTKKLTKHTYVVRIAGEKKRNRRATIQQL
ncbi:unnamed protein product, partial [Trichogramma brassicae]